jgi:histidyl-tRNA synthetase
MALSTQPYKGTRDFYPKEMRFRRWMFGKLRESVERFGYEEYDGPMLEPFELYAAKSGQELVEKQLYWLVDRGERKLALRPEMTPTLARMVAARIHELPRPIRLFSIPNLWRYERPQRGRLREHWQLNVDLLGGDTALADAEILHVALELLRGFGGERSVSVRVNSRRLIDGFFRDVLGLSAEAALATAKLADARAKIGEEAYSQGLAELGLAEGLRRELEAFFRSSFEELSERLGGGAGAAAAGVRELSELFALLRESGLEVGSAASAGAEASGVLFDPTVLRGLDYYTGMVFEVFDVSPENRRAMFGGGRYDNLVGLFGNHRLSGVGFGMGDVTLQNFLETHGLVPELGGGLDVLVTLPAANLRSRCEEIARAFRAAGLRVVTPLSVEGFGAQLKSASRNGARFVVLLGETELAQGKLGLKNLATGEQETLSLEEAVRRVAGSTKPILTTSNSTVSTSLAQG